MTNEFDKLYSNIISEENKGLWYNIKKRRETHLVSGKMTLNIESR